MAKPVISLLVPTMQQPWYLGVTLASAMKNATASTVEALVYSQKHGPETEAVIDRIADAGGDVRLVMDSPRNEGVSVCVNECARNATGEFFFYTSDDCCFLPGWDAALLRHVRLGDYQYLTPRSIEPMGTNPCMYAPYNFGRTKSDFNVSALEIFWKSLPKQDVISCFGPPFVSRELWNEVGGFDETYWFGLGTDPDFSAMCRRAAQNKGKDIEFRGVGDSGMYHFQCITTNNMRTPAFTEVSHARFLAKWGFTIREFLDAIGNGRPL